MLGWHESLRGEAVPGTELHVLFFSVRFCSTTLSKSNVSKAMLKFPEKKSESDFPMQDIRFSVSDLVLYFQETLRAF